jgi:hypothetical protein
VGGRLREQEQHLPGLERELPVYALLALLRADADYFSTVSTIEQAAVMQGTTPEALNGVRRNGGDVWGYFKEIVEPPSDGTASEEMCAVGIEPCIAVLVE